MFYAVCLKKKNVQRDVWNAVFEMQYFITLMAYWKTRHNQVSCGFPSQRASNVESSSMPWHHESEKAIISLHWRHNECDSVSNHQPHDCLPNRLFRRSSKKTSQLRVTGLCVGNSPRTGEFPTQMASNAENVSIGWRHHDKSSQR